MAVLLLAEVNDGELSMDATAKAVTAAKELGDVTVLCAGGKATAAGEAARAWRRVGEDPSLGHRLAESTAALIVSLAGDYDLRAGHDGREERDAAGGGAARRDDHLRRLGCRGCRHV